MYFIILINSVPETGIYFLRVKKLQEVLFNINTINIIRLRWSPLQKRTPQKLSNAITQEEAPVLSTLLLPQT